MASLYKWIYEISYRFSQPVWDQDTIPPEVAALAKKGNYVGRALDLGCGTGTHSIFLAQKGYAVVGVDFASKAIELANLKTREAGVKVDFRLGDVTHLDFLHDPFDIALDIGTFHSLNKVERTRYEENLARLTHPGSLFLLWARKDESSFGIGIGPAEIGKIFSTHFLLENTEQASLHGRASAWYWFKHR
jgi:2-polyprenyl-3-methyl-5-hydroxy-6-metoxy-1,4-benzoquinol methylase